MTFDPAKAQAPALFYSSEPGIVLYEPGSALVLFGWSELHDFRTSIAGVTQLGEGSSEEHLNKLELRPEQG